MSSITNSAPESHHFSRRSVVRKPWPGTLLGDLNGYQLLLECTEPSACPDRRKTFDRWAVRTHPNSIFGEVTEEGRPPPSECRVSRIQRQSPITSAEGASSASPGRARCSAT